MYETLCMACFNEKGNTTLCPHCGFEEQVAEPHIRLPRRMVLNGQYLLGKVLGKPGGFGISYLALDLHLNIKLAIKEFFPTHLIGRGADRYQVIPNDPSHAAVYEEGLQGFLKEARTLARFDHANVVRVRNYFEANGTAYLVMDYYEGFNISEWMETNGLFTETAALQLMMPVLDGLREVHRNGILHRDIKPENIYLANGNRPILLDFGAARAAVGAKSQNMSVVLTPGFAPMEQYASSSKQGAWTDVYACGATLYYMTTGRIPAEAMDRLDEDPLVPPRTLRPELSEAFNRVILKAIALKPEDRPQTVAAFQDLLHEALGNAVSNASASAEPVSADNEPPLRTLTCPSCGGLNRVPKGATLEQIRCGHDSCGALLLPRPSVVLRCPNNTCKALNRLDATKLPAYAKCAKCRTSLA